MNTDNIKEYLTEYFSMDNPQYAVMLKGKWGCGKTHFIKQLIYEYNNSINDSSDETITVRPIYISLNGISSVSQVTYLIKKALSPFLYSKGMNIAKKVLFGGIKYATRGTVDFNGDGEKDDITEILQLDAIVDILTKPNDSVKGQKIIIFDDLERCKISVDEVFGYINNLVEHSCCKVVVICDEDKIIKQYKESNLTVQYKDFKEKLIGHTFTIVQDYEAILKDFCHSDSSKIIVDNYDIIVDLFRVSEVENLRIIKQCFSDFNRLYKRMDLSIYQEHDRVSFCKNIIAYFVIAYCEYKSGNTQVDQLEAFEIFLNKQNEDSESVEKKLKRKYNATIAKYNIERSEESIAINNIVQYIENGYIINLQYILDSSRMLNNTKKRDWEILWMYFELSNEEFVSKFKSVKDQFYQGQIEYISEVIHISGLLLKFRNVYNLKEEYIIKKAKRHIKNIIAREDSSKMFVELHGAAFGKQFTMLKSDAIKDLIEYSKTMVANFDRMKNIEYCKSFFESLTDESVAYIYKYFSTNFKGQGYTYEYSPILAHVNPEKFAKNILALSNKSKRQLDWYFGDRYDTIQEITHINVAEKFSDELTFFQKSYSTLKKSSKSSKHVDKMAIDSILLTIEKAIACLSRE